MPLEEYAAKRRFENTPEPPPDKLASKRSANYFCVQRHDATRLHYDFRLQIGPFGRVLAFRASPLNGYFAPSRFSVLEGRAVYAWHGRGWGLRADAGVGTQQVSDTAAHQTEWHFGVALSRGWGANNEVALVGSITNSAGATSTTGTRTEGFRYRTVGLRFRQGL